MKSYHINGKDLFQGIVKYCSANGIYCRYYKSDDGGGSSLVSVYGTENEVAMVENEYPQLRAIRGGN